MDVGWLGLGAMGRGMAASLGRNGHAVQACDISAGHGREGDAAVMKIFPGIELPAKK